MLPSGFCLRGGQPHYSSWPYPTTQVIIFSFCLRRIPLSQAIILHGFILSFHLVMIPYRIHGKSQPDNLKILYWRLDTGLVDSRGSTHRHALCGHFLNHCTPRVEYVFDLPHQWAGPPLRLEEVRGHVHRLCWTCLILGSYVSAKVTDDHLQPCLIPHFITYCGRQNSTTVPKTPVL